MAHSMQPIVAFRQQPMRGIITYKMQLMVAPEKTTARLEFGALLNAALDHIDTCPPKRGRVRWLFKALKKNQVPLVSYEQCRKYLRGKDIPDQANLRIIAERLKIGVSVLQPKEAANDPSDYELDELLRLWKDADTRGRASIMAVARSVVDRPPFPPHNPSVTTRSRETYSRHRTTAR